ncbi:Uncharacterized protein TPAR_02262 [Tolypocladium paradoxum]|uniref:Uncharacterized protein n=1 Tax=Tolypocladium paradoxum TaxID=94208 RepID=A0A2S4L511_9HYPO|nr:Uncharacterized protein TPAR_02262 [Tolypocladium paradoxum]
MALTLPLHNVTSSMVKLPKPSLIRQDTRLASPSSIDREYSNLAHYITLSSNPIFLSPSCDPIIEVLKPLIDSNSLEILGHVLTLRRPNITPLYHTKTILAIIPFLQTLHSPIPSRPIPEVTA